MFPLILTQIDGDNPIQIALEYSALPEQELPVKSSLSYIKKYYPGADEPTMQILNIEDNTIRLKGLLSDRESRVDGFADATRQALNLMFRQAKVVRLLYRSTIIGGLIANLDFYEEDQWECRYEIEFDPIRPAPIPSDVVETLDRLSTQALLDRLDRFDQAYEELPEEIRTPPANSVYTEEDTPEPERIPPVEFVLDPWLELRLTIVEVHKRIRMILELAGNETLLNLDDRAQVIARGAEIAVNKVRYGLDEWDGSGLGLLDQLTQSRNVYAATSSMDSLALALG